MNKAAINPAPLVWPLPPRIDGHNKDEMQRHIANIAELGSGSQLTLDLRPLALFDFVGAAFLLDLIAQARISKISILLYVKNDSLAALLRFMQFDLLAEIRITKSEKEIVNV